MKINKYEFISREKCAESKEGKNSFALSQPSRDSKFLHLFLSVLICGLISLPAVRADEEIVHMLVPGFTVRELPIKISNINNLRFAPDGRLTALGYDGRIHLLRDSDNDGLEDQDELFWDQPTITVPVGMCWSPEGLYVSSHGKVSLLRDTDGDGKADVEEIIASGWPPTDVGSGGVDATAVTRDADGNIYFGLLVADYSNGYRIKEGVSHYDINSPRGTIQKWNVKTKKLETIATGIRVPFALAFNKAGDLFNTDQEGETWMPNGNPLDELNYIIPGKNYGFPPRHEKWLPNLISEPPVVAFGPQHQSSCGLVFNEPESKHKFNPGRKLFGPKFWEGNAFVAGESRGKIWRVQLVKTPTGYAGQEFLIARLSMLTMDVAISPKGDLYVCCHSGTPDWGTGPRGEGKIFKISYTDTNAPQPVVASAASQTEARIAFDKPIDASITNFVDAMNIEFGEFVSAADRYEVLKPPYKAVKMQEQTPRGKLKIFSAKLEKNQKVLVLSTAPHPLAVKYAITLPGIKAQGARGPGSIVDVEYDFNGPSPKPHTTLPTENPELIGGDFERGKNLFFNEQLKCAACHRIRGQGKIIAPDLSNLVSRDAASVLRDIKEPSASIHPDYVAFTISLNDGEELSGFVRAQKEGSLTVLGVDGKETVVARKNLKELRANSVSLMPSGLLDNLKEEQVRDLLTFLLNEPPKRTRQEVEKILGETNKSEIDSKSALQIVLVAGKQDHGAGQHDYPAWQKKWSEFLARDKNILVTNAWEWPTKEQFQKAQVLVFYFWNHDWSQERYQQLDEFLARGGGAVFLHSATIADKESEQLAQRIGLAS
ncbi:MAG: PQQ-dependent sugar dehydrogenase, partial [Verrucomicrobiota bacterium]|nr:PQQ-dependent sugar dehydrogenase [Verrucomicrobiota bacterium]